MKLTKIVCSWIFIPGTLDELRAAPPVIRFSGGVFVGPLLIPLTLWLTLVHCMLACDAKHLYARLSRYTNVVALWTIVPGLIGLVLQPLIVRIAMPMYDYSICHKLQGSLSMWHNDWVRDPEWCVRGKSREWVFEQAAAKVERQTLEDAGSPAHRVMPADTVRAGLPSD